MKTGVFGHFWPLPVVGLWALALSSVAAAAPCTNSDGTTAPNLDLTAAGGCLNQLPTLSQGPEGTCWAHSHAVLFESYRRCHEHQTSGGFQAAALPTAVFSDAAGSTHGGIRTRMNNADNAACTAAHRTSRSCEGGVLTSSAASTAGGSVEIADRVMRARNGMCDQNAIAIADGGELDRLEREFRRIKNELVRRLWSLKQSCERYQRLLGEGGISGWASTIGETDTCPEYRTELAAAQTWLEQQICDCRAQMLQVNVDILTTANEVLNQAESWLNNNTAYLLGTVLNRRCEGHMVTPAQINLPELRTDGMFSGPTVNSLLNQNRVVEISFCAGSLRHSYGTSFRGLLPFLDRGPRMQCAQDCGCQPHSAVIVGRVTAGDQCVYRVRNSWGADCSHHPEATRRFCDPRTGDFLIPETELDNNVFSFSYY